MNDKNAQHYAQLTELHRILNGILGLGFRYIAVNDKRRRRAALHIVTPQWLANCTMMPFRSDHTLCTNTLTRRTENGYGQVQDRTFYDEIPDPADVPTYMGEIVELYVCPNCVNSLRNVVWPMFDDDEDLEGVEHSIQVDKPKNAVRAIWRGR